MALLKRYRLGPFRSVTLPDLDLTPGKREGVAAETSLTQRLVAEGALVEVETVGEQEPVMTAPDPGVVLAARVASLESVLGTVMDDAALLAAVQEQAASQATQQAAVAAQIAELQAVASTVPTVIGSSEQDRASLRVALTALAASSMPRAEALATVEALETSIQGKASVATVTALGEAVSAAEGGLAAHAVTLAAVQVGLVGKVDSAAMTAALASRATVADLEAAEAALATVQTQMAGKASTGDLVAVQNALAGVQAAVGALPAPVSLSSLAIGVGTTPALALAAQVDVTVPLSQAMTGTGYTVRLARSPSLGDAAVTIKSRTTSAVVVTVKATLAVGAGTVVLLAF